MRVCCVSLISEHEHDLRPDVASQAALWDKWKDPKTGKNLYSFTILTTEATQDFGG